MKNKKQVKIAVFVIVILLAMGGLGGFFYYRSAAYAYRNFIRELHRLDTEKIVHRIEIQDGPFPWIGIHVYLKNHMFPKSKKIPMKDLAELTERYREACDRLLTEENPDCQGPYGNLCLYFHPSAYMTGQSYVIFELERKIEWDEKTGEQKGFYWYRAIDNFDLYTDMFIEDGTAHPK